MPRSPEPRAAVVAAIAGQRSLEEEPWPTAHPLRVRMAIHAGTVGTRDGDFHGQVLNRVARLLAIGHGGQVLISEVVARLVEDASLIDHGSHRLRDIESAEHVFELAASAAIRDVPRVALRGATRTNVPQQLTTFIGRAQELAELEASSARHRLVTLVGVGGTGKTRLMLEAAGTPRSTGHADGVWLVELAPLADADAVGVEVARTLGVIAQPTRPVVETLVDFLAARSSTSCSTTAST